MKHKILHLIGLPKTKMLVFGSSFLLIGSLLGFVLSTHNPQVLGINATSVTSNDPENITTPTVTNTQKEETNNSAPTSQPTTSPTSTPSSTTTQPSPTPNQQPQPSPTPPCNK